MTDMQVTFCASFCLYLYILSIAKLFYNVYKKFIFCLYSGLTGVFKFCRVYTKYTKIPGFLCRGFFLIYFFDFFYDAFSDDAENLSYEELLLCDSVVSKGLLSYGTELSA